jgi:hypothetical protein
MKIMNTILFIALLALVQNGEAQEFVNLDFESANVSGYPPNSMDVPVTSALPGWSAYGINSSGTNALAQVGYDFISLGSAGTSVIDSSAPSFLPLQGEYSAFLFGSLVPSFVGDTAVISQTGLVPNGTMSLLMDVYAFDNFEVTLGGQTINMIPLQTFSNYTLYGGDISSFAGHNETLSLIAPPTGEPNGVEFDSIVFSPSSVPEPGEFVLVTLGALLLGFLRKIEVKRKLERKIVPPVLFRV